MVGRQEERNDHESARLRRVLYLAHFTRDGEPYGIKDQHNPVNTFAKMTAGERLISILKSGAIAACKNVVDGSASGGPH